MGLQQTRAQESDDIGQDLSESGEGHMREELGVNDTTTPQIQKLLIDLDNFQPIR